MLTINLEKFNELMKNEALTVTGFAKKIGVSRTQVWRIFNSKSQPGSEFIAKFKRAYPSKKLDEYFFNSDVA